MAKQKQNRNMRGGSNNRNRREQPRKDSKSPRVNYDNERVSKVVEDMRKNSGYTDSRSNDISWYAQNPELLRSAASLPFSTTTGLPLNLNNDPEHKIVSCIPGVMALTWEPSIGGTFVDPINAASNQLYSYVVHKNSRNKSYDAPDLMIMTLCGASLLSFIAFGIRAYGVMRSFDQRNRYLPQGLIEAMDFDYEDLKSNLSNMWFNLNEIIARVSQIWLPKTMPFIQRWFWMNTNLYTDGASVKSQYYMFVPHAVLQYNETGDYFAENHVAQADFVYWYHGKFVDSQLALHTWQDYLDIVNKMISNLIESQDRGTIYGDILKAYGEENLVSISPITPDYTVVPAYDREVLTQIENATIRGYHINTPEAFSQDPSTNNIYTKGYMPVTQAARFPTLDDDGNMPGVPEVQILNFHQPETPTPEQIMIATRLKCAGIAGIWNGKSGITYGSNKYGGVYVGTCGTEVLVTAHVTHYVDSEIRHIDISDNISAINWASVFSMNNAGIWLWNSFDWAPWLYNCVFHTTAWTKDTFNQAVTAADFVSKSSTLCKGATGDYDYYTTISIEELRKMHQTALYSEFGVPIL